MAHTDTEYVSAAGILAAREKGWDGVLEEFRKPVNPALIKSKPGKGNASYIPHHTTRQYLHLAFDHANIITDEVIDKGDGQYAVKCRLVCSLNGDERTFHGWGESDNKDFPLKSAESDAFKRICGMELGLGLHLWAQQTYFLNQLPTSSSVPEPPADEDAPAGTPPEPAGATPPPDDLDNLRKRFMATLNDAGFNYDKDIKPFLAAHYSGRSWSTLTPPEKRALAKKVGDDPQAFGQKVRTWKASAA